MSVIFRKIIFLTFHPQTNFNVSKVYGSYVGKQQQMTLFRPFKFYDPEEKYKSLKKC